MTELNIVEVVNRLNGKYVVFMRGAVFVPPNEKASRDFYIGDYFLISNNALNENDHDGVMRVLSLFDNVRPTARLFNKKIDAIKFAEDIRAQADSQLDNVQARGELAQQKLQNIGRPVSSHIAEGDVEAAVSKVLAKLGVDTNNVSSNDQVDSANRQGVQGVQSKKPGRPPSKGDAG